MATKKNVETQPSNTDSQYGDLLKLLSKAGDEDFSGAIGAVNDANLFPNSQTNIGDEIRGVFLRSEAKGQKTYYVFATVDGEKAVPGSRLARELSKLTAGIPVRVIYKGVSETVGVGGRKSTSNMLSVDALRPTVE